MFLFVFTYLFRLKLSTVKSSSFVLGLKRRIYSIFYVVAVMVRSRSFSSYVQRRSQRGFCSNHLRGPTPIEQVLKCSTCNSGIDLLLLF